MDFFNSFKKIFTGEYSEMEMEVFLKNLSVRGETEDEIAMAAEIMRSFAVPFTLPANTEIFDVCGTGGSGSAKTFNLSTTVAFVLAGNGVCVAKHGNRAASSPSGSADMLEKLGISLEKTPKETEKILEKVGIAFLFAQKMHPCMKNIMPVRKKIGHRTIFNILGPLTNPANPDRQMMGVYAENLVEKCAHVLQKLGKKSAMVVHGKDGLDEISLTEETLVSFFSETLPMKTEIFHPKNLGFSSVPHAALQGGNAEQNAEIFVDLLWHQKKNPKRDLLILNAGMAFFVAGKAKTPQEGVEKAEESIDSGNAWKKFEELKDNT